MNYSEKKAALEQHYTDLLLDLIKQKANRGPKTYGIEYEFLSSSPLNLDLMEDLYMFLSERGYITDKDSFLHTSGMYITFEPGGQIEYHSLPIPAEDNEMIKGFLDWIEETNSNIHKEVGIKYVAIGYIPGRGDSPLCLKAKRYKNLHSRMQKCGSRGLEMMKGTASIHLHVGINDTLELGPLYSSLSKMTSINGFKMGQDRRDIWNNTDPTRCGLPYRNIDDNSEPRRVAEELVHFTLNADDIGENIPFYGTKDLTFDAFMYHMTTIFTDVRLNIKGPSIELRTMDSVPFPQFLKQWTIFKSRIKDDLLQKGLRL